ncbi:uncharacterized protein APUU_50605A [Aspergillus puulaauensis]|uniref:Uncharacterized protein n=1 Tax=Aspergillus puulaauensis TaxID=1220207 RepID=A0A7R7XR47_9EURO|nr:uncharacterized protein APUU_50605A [Aspergillus puulaauensis]BCS25894.1 hypothetical protein APUU_50605A [Aspergillus puulaauensis]
MTWMVIKHLQTLRPVVTFRYRYFHQPSFAHSTLSKASELQIKAAATDLLHSFEVRSTALTISLQCRLQVDRWAPTPSLKKRFLGMFFVRFNCPPTFTMRRGNQKLVPGGTLSHTGGYTTG